MTKQVFYKSKDGTKVPMFITHKKGIKLDGKNPTLLYGYGGFNISLTPSFSVRRIAWLEMGGVYAGPTCAAAASTAKTWHQAGTKLHEAERLRRLHRGGRVADRREVHLTPKLAIKGGSNGGLLVGACMTQRPDLFGAACPPSA